MKRKIASPFILLIIFICGCDDSAVNNSHTNDIQKVSKKELTVPKNFKKREDIVKKAKIKIQKKAVKKVPKYKVKHNKQNESKNFVKVDQPKEKQVLDLTLLFEFDTEKMSDNSPGFEKQSYLPDLFLDKKNKRKYLLQIDGKIIERVELEEDKERAADGVGLDFKLLP